MKITSCVLAALVFGALSTTTGIAEQRATVPDNSATRSEPGNAALSQPARNRGFNPNGVEADTAAGRSNANQPGLANGHEGLRSRWSAGRDLVRQLSAAGPLNHTGISGTNLVRTGFGPAAVGGPVKNAGSINGTTFGQKHHSLRRRKDAGHKQSPPNGNGSSYDLIIALRRKSCFGRPCVLFKLGDALCEMVAIAMSPIQKSAAEIKTGDCFHDS